MKTEEFNINIHVYFYISLLQLADFKLVLVYVRKNQKNQINLYGKYN